MTVKMAKVTDYRIVHNVNPVKVSLEIAPLLKEDWQPYGELQTTVIDHHSRVVMYTQVLVKYTELWPEV